MIGYTANYCSVERELEERRRELSATEDLIAEREAEAAAIEERIHSQAISLDENTTLALDLQRTLVLMFDRLSSLKVGKGEGEWA